MVVLCLGVKLVTVDMMVKTLLDSAPLYVEIWEHKDGELRFMDCNERAVTVFGVKSKQDVMDLTFVDRPEYQPDGRESTEMIYATLNHVLEHGHGKAAFSLMNVLGEEMPFEFTFTRVSLPDRQIIVCYGYDLREAIAAREEVEAERVAAKIDALEREKRFKENILATISHELRTPLAVMSVYAEMAVRQIKSGKVTDEAIAALDTISDESHRLAALASNALDMFVKKVANETKAYVDIPKMVAQFVSILDSTAKKRGVKLHSHFPQDLPQVWAVSGELTRVFWNILDNAIRYTKNGTINISAMSAQDKVIISIADTGCGMNAESKSRAFEHGFGEGSGLGLSFCKDIIKAHGGEISIESEFGLGTSVTFSLGTVEELSE